MPIYADNSATTQVRPEVVEAMLPYLANNWGNASSIHAMGRVARSAIDKARGQIAALLNCSSEEVYFSSCGTNSNNLAILGRARFVEANDRGKHLITTTIEHPSGLGPPKFLEGRGWDITYLPVNAEGFVNLTQLVSAIRPETSIISIIWANNEIGSVQDIPAIAKIAKEREIFFHSDAVQMPGKLPIDLSTIPLSTLSLSGHKFYAPKGIGVLFAREGVNLMPLEFGGGQEKGLLPGTEAVANIVAIGKAAELAAQELNETSNKLKEMQKMVFAKLDKSPNVKITGPCDLGNRLPGHVSLVSSEMEGEALVMRCDLQGICVSSGSACHQGMIEPSHVLKAIGLNDKQAIGSLRISLGKFNTVAECEEIGEKLTNIFKVTGESKSKVS